MNKPRRAHIAYVLLRHLRRRDCNIFNRREHDLNDNNLSVTTKKK